MCSFRVCVHGYLALSLAKGEPKQNLHNLFRRCGFAYLFKHVFLSTFTEMPQDQPLWFFRFPHELRLKVEEGFIFGKLSKHPGLQLRITSAINQLQQLLTVFISPLLPWLWRYKSLFLREVLPSASGR